jgi:DNA-binding response OmpR family regulator
MPDSRILVVEDEPTSREIVDFVLSEAGYGVDMAATAAAALMLLSSTRYGLMVADWMLPDGDGIYIADRALALGSYPPVERPPAPMQVYRRPPLERSVAATTC